MTEAVPDMSETPSVADSANKPAAKSAELRTRIISALVLAPIALGLTWIGGWPFAGLLAVAALAMAWESANLLPGLTPVLRIMLAIFAIITIALTAGGEPLLALLVGLAGLSLAVTIAILTAAPLAPVAIAFPYLVLPLVAFMWLRLDPEYGRIAVFWLLFVVWATDTFAYIAGRTIGGRKLAPAFSPNKTWTGLCGGMAGAALVGLIASLWLHLGSALGLAIVSAFIALVAQAGDIFESALKRRAGVKDSSRLIPGHGGVFDRVDGLITAVVAAGLIAILHGGGHPAVGLLVWP
jgi:phosphatidate cytidylyltransferase